MPHNPQATECATRNRSGTWGALFALVLLTVLVRVPGIHRPLLGHYGTKNAVYAMIARNWALGRAPLWLPTIDCLAGGERGRHLLEIPVSAYVAGAGWAVCGGSLDVWGRAVSIAFSAASVGLLYLLVRRWHSNQAAWAAALVLALSPVSIIFGQSFMLEASVVFFMLGALWCMESWLTTAKRRWFTATVLSLALLLCSKIYMLVMLLPLLALACRRIATLPASERRRWIAGGTALLAIGVLPAAAWCLMVLRLASPDSLLGSHVYDSIRRSGTVHQVPSPLLADAGFYVRLLGNLAGVGLTPVGALLAAVGLCCRPARRHLWWLAAMAALVALLPAKFFELRYYTLIFVPAGAMLAGIGWERLSRHNRWAPIVATACLIVGLAFSARASLRPAFVTPAEDRAVLAAAAAARELGHEAEPLATLHGAGPNLLYYCDRPGWALSANDRRLSDTLDRCRQAGVRWLVVADLEAIAGKPAAISLSNLPIVREGNDYRVYRLSEYPVATAGSRTHESSGRFTRQ